ncbi:MAG: lipoyl synthase [Candidatus Woesearchaeota archaeon]
MSLPVLGDQEYALREVPYQEYAKKATKNFKTPRHEGISNLGKPSWLKIRPPTQEYHNVKQKLSGLGLVTVCQESHCPNMSECWSGGTATFMVLGDTCTRGCRFCSVPARGVPDAPDSEEPQKLLQAVQEMQLEYVVITCVDRDDLPDGGAAHLAACVRAIKEYDDSILVEVLTGDFQGNQEQLHIVVDAGVDVLAHNVETVPRLQRRVRDPRANYAQSLQVLINAKKRNSQVKTKTSLMVGLGETREELSEVMNDLRTIRCDIITFGQYLRPSTWHLPVEYYMPPEEFKELEEEARSKGFLYCAAGPFVRSSYKAGELFLQGVLNT